MMRQISILLSFPNGVIKYDSGLNGFLINDINPRSFWSTHVNEGLSIISSGNPQWTYYLNTNNSAFCKCVGNFSSPH